jgi:Major Facilitator Superfamily
MQSTNHSIQYTLWKLVTQSVAILIAKLFLLRNHKLGELHASTRTFCMIGMVDTQDKRQRLSSPAVLQNVSNFHHHRLERISSSERFEPDDVSRPRSAPGPLNGGGTPTVDAREQAANHSKEPTQLTWTNLNLQVPRQDGSTRQSLISTISSRLSRLPRPLSFNGSIWLKNPDDIVPQFDIVTVTELADIDIFDPPVHIRTRRTKKRLVYLISLAAMFSPLSSNIYFPALPTISKALKTPQALVSLSISIYMLFQGIAPSFWGPLADAYGRRPVMLATLLVYIAANAVLSAPGSFAVLMVFRGLQASGSASTIAIGAGMIGDIASAAERGGFMGLFGGSELRDDDKTELS